jgi:thiamine transport system ATP-binding protein
LALCVEQLNIVYPDWQRSYSFSAEASERLAIKGPSGIGKSTLLLCLAGFIKPQSGSVRWCDQDLLALEPQQRPISMLFQEDNLFEHLSVQRNLELGLDAQGLKSLSDAVTRLGLAEQVNKLPGQLSGGQRQRVGLIRTLLRPEPLIILDEPFAELDAQSRSEALEFSREQIELRSKTLLLITHQDEDIAALATRTLHLS